MRNQQSWQGYGNFELSLELPCELAKTMLKICKSNHSTAPLDA